MALVIRTTGVADYFERSGGAYVKALVLGAPDAGKTRSASFWPKPIFADCEQGRMSIADRAVPYGEITSSADMDALLDHVRKDALKPTASRQYQTFVLDTLDSYQRILVNERLRAERKEALSGFADWGWLDAKMNRLIDRLLALPINLVVNLHVKGIDDEGNQAKLGPKLKGDIKDQIAADFDLVGLMEVGYEASSGERVKTRTIRWHSEPKFPFLKDRSGKLPRQTDVTFTEADYQTIYDAVVSAVDLPEGEVVETLATSDDAEVAPPTETGGPVEADVPAPKAAKKTAAKKTAAKATAAKPAAATSVPDPEPTAEPVAEPETPVADPEDVATDVADSDGVEAPAEIVEEAVATVADTLGGEVINEVTDDDGATDQGDTGPSDDAPHCGDQPDSLAGKFPAAEGCGKSLAGENRDRVNVAVLRAKTLLCEQCFTTWKSTH